MNPYFVAVLWGIAITLNVLCFLLGIYCLKTRNVQQTARIVYVVMLGNVIALLVSGMVLASHLHR